jgi:hypothetical protein
MPFKYSLFVNGRHLGPYERRMIVGMRVKNLVTDDQLVQRHDGLDMTVAELMEDRLESKPNPLSMYDSGMESKLGAPSSGMWPQYTVKFGGTAMKPGAFGFSGGGSVSYQGDQLRFTGNRRNSSLGMSRQIESLPVAAIETSMTDGSVLELVIKPRQTLNSEAHSLPVRIECRSDDEANELWELLNMRPGELPHGLSFAKTASGDLE